MFLNKNLSQAYFIESVFSPCDQIATRKAYGIALAKLGRYNERVVVLDGDTKNSTFSELFKNEHPNRYVECYIAEQNMVRMVHSKRAGESFTGEAKV